MENEKNSKGGFLTTFIWIFAIYGGLALVDKYFVNIPIYDNISGSISKIFSSDKKASLKNYPKNTIEPIEQQNSDQNSSTKFSSIVILPEISEEVDNSPVVKYFQFDNELKTKIKIILSDPNPNSENKSGQYCGDLIGNCKWCRKQIIESKEYSTTKDYLEYILFSSFAKSAIRLAENFDTDGQQRKSFLNEIQGLSQEFSNGNKYRCDLPYTGQKGNVIYPYRPKSLNEFCSKKCESEFKNSR
jgi:hypothetical protein